MSNNKKKPFRYFYFFQMVFVWIGMTSVTPCFATFDVMDENTEGYYGNAEIRPFKEMLEGSDPLSPADKAFLDSISEQRTTERNYVRVLVGHPKVNLKNVSNDSSPPYNLLPVPSTAGSDTLYQLLIAVGHIWEHWAIELELFLSKPLNFTIGPLFAGSPLTLDASVKQYALFANGEYIIPRWFSFYPRRLQIHLDAGVGGGLAVTNASVTSTNGVFSQESQSVYYVSLAGMLGAGFRYQLTDHFLVDFAYRFINIGKVKFGPLTQLGLIFESNQLSSSGFFVGLTYQI